jgi:hypothetical protein
MFVIFLCVAVTIVVSYARWNRQLSKDMTQAQQQPLPPGPKRQPVIGNALELPTEYPWLVYHEWAKQHGRLSYGFLWLWEF